MPSGKGYLTASVLDLMLPSWLREGDVHEYIRQTPRGPSHQSPIHTDMWGYMSHTSVWSNRHVGVHVPRLCVVQQHTPSMTSPDSAVP